MKQDRRDFIKTTATAASLCALSSASSVFAAGSTSMYTNIIYTKENPGRWASKVGSHAPQVTVKDGKVNVVIKHPMTEEHFIVRHTLVLADGTFVGSKNFTPADKPESSYDLPAGYKGKFFVTSFCNKHDFWLAEAVA